MPVKKVNKKIKNPAKKAVGRVVKKTTKKKIVKKVVKKMTPQKKVVKKVSKNVTKKAAKKVTKKPVTRQTKKKGGRSKQRPTPVTASNEASFWINNGPIVNSLSALKEAFRVITVEQYEFHAGGDQNDFAIWVEMVLCDKDCASKLKKAKTQKTAAKKVAESLKKYKK